MCSINERNPHIWSLFKAEVIYNSAILPHEKAACIRACYSEDFYAYYFPIGQLAKDLDIDVFVDDLSNLDVWGYLALKVGRKDVIVVSNSIDQAYQRWTIAHLLWHFFTNKNKIKKDTFFGKKGFLMDGKEEKAANQFALCLLLPQNLFRSLWIDYTDEPEYIRREAFLARFGVPIEAYEMRLKKLSQR